MGDRPLTSNEREWGLSPAMRRELLKYRDEQVRLRIATNGNSTPALEARHLIESDTWGGRPCLYLTSAGQVAIVLLLELGADNG